ncbi:MAG: SDR family oxidoreductase [Faecalibacterium sp.]|nr:SDR family oxidoreductase [Ruminococcus sp.]MCM1391471.1 SDR family oxidoreductase [Ruminococcus sp.]MCM1485271.1 SDR family oxidoreductase [Faecalibacterium sp.]
MKIAVITGASSGIGLECANLFSQSGYKVYALSRRGGTDEKITHIKCDVTDEKMVADAFAKVFAAEGRIDVLVNNAGFGISGAIEFTELEQAKKQLDVNFFGCFNCCKAVIGYMRQNKGGRIVNISSMAAPLAIPFQAFYSASKAAINSLTLALANEVKPFGITVCALMPGDVKTSFTAVREKEMAGDEFYGETIKKSVAAMEKDEQNGMSAQSIAKAVLRLAEKKHVKPLSTTGAQYKLFAVLSKILPISVINKIVGKIYT